MSNIELLPNEILFECFKYLTGVDIFCAFDQLNDRFNQLIRSIPLYFNFRNIDQSFFDQFCNKILPSKRIQTQIYSLNLSNKHISNQIQLFLSLFSFEKFPQLQSLSLTEVNSHDISQLKLMLPLISHLNSFSLFDTIYGRDELLSVLSTLPSNFKLINQFSSITNLTIAPCYTDELYKILSTITTLTYLKVENVSRHCSSMYDYYVWVLYANIPKNLCINLKHLIIIEYHDRYHELETIFERTPNLTNLTLHIDSNNKINEINAQHLEHWITSFLPFLKIFKFMIRYHYNHSIEQMFRGFQNDFWCKQHHWYTEYLLAETCAWIYTIPYMFHTYELIPSTKIYVNNLVNSSQTFQNVTDLTVDLDALTKNCQYYFSHVTSVTLRVQYNPSILTRTHIENLKIIINLSNLKQLDISRYKLETSTILLELFKEASQLSSLHIHTIVLRTLFDDDELCNYLNKITKLNITEQARRGMNDSVDLNKFCKIFSNLEQLTCQLDQLNTFLFLLKHLPKLSYMNVFYLSFTWGSSMDWLEQ